MDLDNTFSSRDSINAQLRDVLDLATDKWGCKVERVEIKDIKPPSDIRDAMEKQMNAERNKRALILQAEGERQSAITLAEGKKEAAILEAEADKEAKILAADAIKEAKIREAEGEASAIIAVQTAQAEGIRLINDADPSKAYLSLKGMEAFEKAADGKATKIIVPSELQNLAGVAGSVKEFLKD
jgi:regulator of protease activity HflC (stomatin/prohibitin superfamily)